MSFPSKDEYRDIRRWHNYKFQRYRKANESFTRANTKSVWKKAAVPVRRVKVGPYEKGREPWVREYWSAGPDLAAIADSAKDEKKVPARRRGGYRMLQLVKAYLATLPDVDYLCCLGMGGQGIAALCSYVNPDTGVEREFVIKVAQENTAQHTDHNGDPIKDSWISWYTRQEYSEMIKLDRAEHVVQTIPRSEVGLPLPSIDMPDRDMPQDNDSQDGMETDSGDDSPGPRPASFPPVVTRAQVSAAESESRLQRYRERNDEIWYEWDAYVKAQEAAGNPHRDYLVLEYIRNGTLFDLTVRIRKKKTRPPNRVLWSFWLCLVRACVGLQFWPRKFHPKRRDPVPPGASRELREELPPVHKRWRRKTNVHFDIDPQNIFIGNINPDDPEHRIIPKLKLADFGLAQEIKLQKRDSYYEQKRTNAKEYFFAPEQFTNKWDTFGANPHGTGIATYISKGDPVAGNLTPALSVWGIALSMFCLITGYLPPRPPQPGRLKPTPGGPLNLPAGCVSYGSMLMDDEWDHTDPELRAIIARCMAHNPSKRPDLEELLETAIRGQQRPFHGESDAFITGWINAVGLDNNPPPTPPPQPQPPPPPPAPSTSSLTSSDDDGYGPGGNQGTGNPGGNNGYDNPGGGPTEKKTEKKYFDDDGGEVLDFFGIVSDEVEYNWTQYSVPFGHAIDKESEARFLKGFNTEWFEATDFTSGYEAVRASLAAQFGPTLEKTGLPTTVFLQKLFNKVIQKYPAMADFVPGHMSAQLLGAIVYEWGVAKKLNMQLAVVLEGEKSVVITPEYNTETNTVWIIAKRVLAKDFQTEVMTDYLQYGGLEPNPLPGAAAAAVSSDWGF